MANAKRGRCDLRVDGKTIHLVFDFNAVCELETLLNEPFAECAKRWSRNAFNMTEVRAMVWAGMQNRHPEYSVKQCGDIIQQVGIEKLSAMLVEAFSQSFPGNEGESSKEETAEGNAMADAGTGTTS